MRIIIATILASVIGMPTIATAQGKQSDDSVRAFMLCVRAAAARIEPSGDPPDAIATAAVFVCQEKEVVAMNANMASPSGITPANLRKSATDYATAQAVISRLCRKTGDCGLAPIPRDATLSH